LVNKQMSMEGGKSGIGAGKEWKSRWEEKFAKPNGDNELDDTRGKVLGKPLEGESRDQLLKEWGKGYKGKGPKGRGNGEERGGKRGSTTTG